jgi:predicted enzyme related to lactoylglutathione lyase
MAAKYNRAAESLGNILHMEHVNLLIPEQAPAITFYISGLGYTRDPYLMVGLENMWVNMGRSQMHLPRRDPSPQFLRGTVGMVVPDLDDCEQSLRGVKAALKGTKFSVKRKNDRIETTCPWGNKFRVHAPDPEYGDMQIGLPYVELNVPVGSAGKIARFYSEIMGANVSVGERDGRICASVTTGKAQYLHFMETRAKQPDYDGHHVAIYIADFAGPYEKLMKRGLITMESDDYEWRFIDIVDVDTGEVLFKIEHEVRSATHPLYARPLVNRNPAQSNRGYKRGQDTFLGRI